MHRKTSMVLMTLVIVFLAKTRAYMMTDCPESSRLGVSVNYIRDSQMTSSSHLSFSHQAKHGRLYGSSGWCPGPSKSDSQVPESGAWLQVDLKVIHFVCKVAVQGAADHDRWVTMYRLSYSTDGKNWRQEGYYSTGNRDRNTVRESRPFEPRLARYVRFTTTRNRHHNWPCMRVEVFANKPFSFYPNIIKWYSPSKMFILTIPNGKENPDGHGHVKSIYLDQITKTPDNKKSTFVHNIDSINDIYVDIPPRASNLYSGSEVLVVLPHDKYMEAKIVGVQGNDLYEVRRSDNGKTEVFRKDYLRQKGLYACELDNECPDDTTCTSDELNRPSRYYCRCLKGFTETFKSWAWLQWSKCSDINECSKTKDTCPSKSVCTNTVGSYNCKCRTGYHMTSHNQCVDVDECKNVTSPCGVGFNCHNSPGSYKCTDIDECETSPCFQGEVCVNTHGSFRCEIPERKEEEDEETTQPVQSTTYEDLIYPNIKRRPSGENVLNSSCGTCCQWKAIAFFVFSYTLVWL